MTEREAGTSPTMDKRTEHAVRAFMERLEGRYPVQAGILFGSRARQTHETESDADLAVLLTGAPSDRSAAARDMAGIAFDGLLEAGVLVEALPLWADELDRLDAFTNPALIRAIRRDGLRL